MENAPFVANSEIEERKKGRLTSTRQVKHRYKRRNYTGGSQSRTSLSRRFGLPNEFSYVFSGFNLQLQITTLQKPLHHHLHFLVLKMMRLTRPRLRHRRLHIYFRRNLLFLFHIFSLLLSLSPPGDYVIIPTFFSFTPRTIPYIYSRPPLSFFISIFSPKRKKYISTRSTILMKISFFFYIIIIQNSCFNSLNGFFLIYFILKNF